MNSTFRYLIKNFFYLILPAIIPSVLIALFCDPLKPLIFFTQLLQNPYNIGIELFYKDIYFYFSSVNLQHLLMWFATVFIVSIGIGVICGAVERHTRIGVRSYSKILSMINNSILHILPIVIIALFAYEIIVLIYSGLVLLLSLFLTGYTFIIVCLVAYLIMIALIILAMAYTLCTIPIMINDGYKLNIAFSYSLSIISKKGFAVFSQLFIVVFAYIVLMCLAKLFLISITFLILKAVFSGFLLLYVTATSIITYTTLTNGTRADLQKSIFKN